ncbi:hypothetical protein SKAU_G00208240 [Synaphobranchus kaupii]|uniref:Uncharacterized protein n=1 Tax=Synaphobranchus kaupii TaxID=118154 RepID=A0A9Q1F8K8_SYNKA|nr:hypothetical protein SKAU_G00208240 [Synaphobranchus kaupii]
MWGGNQKSYSYFMRWLSTCRASRQQCPPIRRCYVLSEDLERDNLDGGEWKFCEGRPQGHEQFGFCQQGPAASFTPTNNYILFDCIALEAGGDGCIALEAGGDGCIALEAGDDGCIALEAGGDGCITLEAGDDGCIALEAGGDGCIALEAGGDGCIALEAGGDGCIALEAGGDGCIALEAGGDDCIALEAGGDGCIALEAGGDGCIALEAGGDGCIAQETGRRGRRQRRLGDRPGRPAWETGLGDRPVATNGFLKVQQAFSTLNLLLNTTKTKVMWFGRKGSVPLPARDITTLDGAILDQVTEYKYLNRSRSHSSPAPPNRLSVSITFPGFSYSHCSPAASYLDSLSFMFSLCFRSLVEA